MTPTKQANLIMSVQNIASVFQYRYQECLNNVMQVSDLASAIASSSVQLSSNVPVNASWQLNGVEVSMNLESTYSNCKNTC